MDKQPFRLSTSDADMMFAGEDQLSPSFARLSLDRPPGFFQFGAPQDSGTFLKQGGPDSIMKVVDSPPNGIPNFSAHDIAAFGYASDSKADDNRTPNRGGAHVEGEEEDHLSSAEKASRKRTRPPGQPPLDEAALVGGVGLVPGAAVSPQHQLQQQQLAQAQGAGAVGVVGGLGGAGAEMKQRNRRRRQIEELEPSEIWRCPFACNKVYKKSSTRSIYKHLASCPRRSVSG